MYTYASHSDKSSRPCGGVRYNTLHNTSLSLHEIDMLGIIKKDFSQEEYKGKEQAEPLKKSGGGRKCGGALYALYHPHEHHSQGHHHKKHRHPEKKTIDSHFEHRSPAEQPTAHAGENQRNYHSSQDMFSVEELLAYTSASRESYALKTFARALESSYSRIEREAVGRAEKRLDPVYSMAEEVEKKYGRKYGKGSIRKYEGRDMAKKALAKPEKAESGGEKRRLAEDIEKALKNMEKTTRKERRPVKKAAKTKNEANRHSLPSGLKAVRKRPERSSSKGRKSRPFCNNPKQPQSAGHKEKHRRSREI